MNEFNIIQLFLFIMVVLTLINGLVYFKKLIKLQEENNELLKKLLKEDIKEENNGALPYNEIEKLKTEFMKNNR
jgi:Na+-translocating ferredoxin:NAD+ oxidoreductase RnfG subunit